MKTMLIVLSLLTLTGCLSSKQYPQTCQITQPDKTGTGYTVGTMPCALQHHEGKEKP